MFGHSLGGATAAAAMLDDQRIKAGVNLDGTLFGPVVNAGLDRPFMLVGADAIRTPAPPAGTTAPGTTWTGTPPTPWPAASAAELINRYRLMSRTARRESPLSTGFRHGWLIPRRTCLCDPRPPRERGRCLSNRSRITAGAHQDTSGSPSHANEKRH